jgi:hypothetical protein
VQQQHAVFEGLDGGPTREKIEKALGGQRASGPGDPVASAAIWKLLLSPSAWRRTGGSGKRCWRASGHGDSLFCRYKELGRLRKDTALTNRGPR